MTSARWVKALTLLAMCLGLLMLQLDTTVVNLALPRIQRSLHADVGALQWIIDSYNLTCKEVMMETLLILILLLIVLDLAALRWGFDSTEKLESPEWERRRMWAASPYEHEGNHTRARRLESNGHLPARKLLDKERVWLNRQSSKFTIVIQKERRR